MQLALKAVEFGNVNAISDGGTATAFARAAIHGAGLNVRINLLGLEKETDPSRMLKELANIEKQADKIVESVQVLLHERGGMEMD
jgi:formiminotetrahydrofolate cyclodeaminase